MRHRAIMAFLCSLLCVSTQAPAAPCPPRADPYLTAQDYAIRFFPRWLTWTQSESAGNQLEGPNGMGPQFKQIVAVNDDTIYAGAFLDLSGGPLVLTIPPYDNTYSILQLDVFGNIFTNQLAPDPNGGIYALVGPGFTGKLPAGVTRVDLPYASAEMFIRADKYSSSGVNQIEAATSFRAALQLQTLSDWEADPSGGQTLVLPLAAFGAPMKRMADTAMALDTEAFLDTLQTALASPKTTPLSAADLALRARFDCLYRVAKSDPNPRMLSAIVAGARSAHKAIVEHWQTHTDVHGWIHFDNIGQWGTNWLDRASLSEYIQFGNGPTTTFYAHAFVDAQGAPLDGSRLTAYSITFAPSEVPEYKRFWSLTAYTPEEVELVPNPANKYVVASYTPGLVTEPDGSIKIYLQPNRPKRTGAPAANWLPVPDGRFNIMLRIYGPEGTALDGKYVPPVIERTGAM
jgi:hypothetical protein